MSESAGYLENTKNDKPVFNNEVLFDLTKIRTGLSIHDYSSQHSASTAENTDGAAVNAIDGNPKTYWHSKWGSTDTLPQWITVNLGEVKNIYKLSYIPRQNQSSGRVTKYEILGSTNGVDFDKITSGTFTTGTNEQYTEFAPTEVQYIRFKVNESTVAGSCNVAELGFYEYQEGVIEAGNKAQLQTLVASLAELDEADYSDASWTRLMAEKAKAEAALAEEVISQSRLDAAYNSLLLAKRQLVDITFADAMKAAYAALNETDYTTESWEAFETAMAEINIDELLNAADTNREATHVIMKVNYEMSKLVEQEVKKTYAVKVKQVDGTLVEQGTYDYNDKVVITEADVPNAPEGKNL